MFLFVWVSFVLVFLLFVKKKLWVVMCKKEGSLMDWSICLLASVFSMMCLVGKSKSLCIVSVFVLVFMRC